MSRPEEDAPGMGREPLEESAGRDMLAGAAEKDEPQVLKSLRRSVWIRLEDVYDETLDVHLPRFWRSVPGVGTVLRIMDGVRGAGGMMSPFPPPPPPETHGERRQRLRAAGGQDNRGSQ